MLPAAAVGPTSDRRWRHTNDLQSRMATTRYAIVESCAIISNIPVIRGHGVLLDSNLAVLYQVEMKALTNLAP